MDEVSEGNSLARQLPRLHAAHLSRTVIGLAAGGALCVGLAATGTSSAAHVVAPPAPPVVRADAVYVHFQPVGQAAAVARAMAAAVVRWSAAQRSAALQDLVVLQAPRRALASVVDLAAQRAGAVRIAAARRAAVARRAAAARAAQARRAAVAQAARRRALLAGLRRDTGPVATVQPAALSGTPREIAARLLDADGWSGQFSCLDALWEQESGWNVYAENPSSGAYGIPQALYGAEMASAGPDWRSDAETQIKWGLSYIAARYGSPCGAWEHEEATGWY